MVFIQDPDFNNDKEKAWEMAWNRYKQSKRNDEALNITKHNVYKFHSHSKDRKLFKPITYSVEKQSTPAPFFADAKEVRPDFPKIPNRDYEFPPKSSEKLYIQEPKETKDISLAPRTALENLREILRGK